MSPKQLSQQISAPMPYFGGKAKIAPLVWERFGNPHLYVEPFGGSLAVLLARPTEHEWWNKIETAGDAAGLVVNFYRAVSKNPEEVARLASWPVTEADLTARHLYLVRNDEELTKKLLSDPEYFDVKAAAWWVWGISAWVGGEWCSGLGPWKPGDENGPGVYRKMPMIAGSHGGKGIHKPRTISSEGSEAVKVREHYEKELLASFEVLADRLRRVRLVCGDWSRLTNSAVKPSGKQIGAVFLDPPYDLSQRRGDLYGPGDNSKSERDVHVEARTWALEAGALPNMRVAYCSYSSKEEDAIFEKARWTPVQWVAQGGYGLQSNNAARENRAKEIIWFSPKCLKGEKR